MCIRDRTGGLRGAIRKIVDDFKWQRPFADLERDVNYVYRACLLYTSDAADERSSVALGGRRIIKKKNDVATVRKTHDRQI